MSETTTTRTAGWALGLLTVGVIGGAAIGALPSASAAGSAATTASYAVAAPGQTTPGGTETPLTGDTASQVEAAVLAAYPGATVDRLETDSGGTAAYEAHLTTAEGERLTVFVDEAFAVVSTQEGRGGPGGRGGDCPEGTAPGDSTDPATPAPADPSAEGVAYVA